MWQKESTKNNALYVNLCAGNRSDTIYRDVRSEIDVDKAMKSLSEKSDAMSQKKRKLANACFSERNWEDAIDWYNEALCFAERGSAALGIAFANRSACFFNMKQYHECLVDIELAKENNCAKSSIPELEQRKLMCQMYIANGWQREEGTLQMDFEESEKFPGMSNAIEITKGVDNKYAVVAKQNINVGQIIAIDKGFTKTLYMIYGWKCAICLKSSANLVPCKKCTTAMFCHDCVDNTLHKYECGMKTSVYSTFNNYLMQELRTFFIAMNLFSDAKEMMHFVEQSIANDEIPDSLKDDRSKYHAFLKLTNNTLESKHEQFKQIVYCVYKVLLDIPKVRND